MARGMGLRRRTMAVIVKKVLVGDMLKYPGERDAGSDSDSLARSLRSSGENDVVRGKLGALLGCAAAASGEVCEVVACNS